MSETVSLPEIWLMIKFLDFSRSLEFWKSCIIREKRRAKCCIKKVLEEHDNLCIWMTCWQYRPKVLVGKCSWLRLTKNHIEQVRKIMHSWLMNASSTRYTYAVFSIHFMFKTSNILIKNTNIRLNDFIKQLQKTKPYM